MTTPKPSAIRRGLLWWFQAPADPYLSCSFVVDIRAARSWLRELGARHGRRFTLQHLVTAAVVRIQRRFPMANARIVGRRIVPVDTVGVALPVNLLDQGRGRELSLTVLSAAEGLRFVELAEKADGLIAAERADRVTNPLFRTLLAAFEGLPDGPLWAGLDLIEGLRRLPPVADRLFAAVPVTTGITNPGAAVRMPPGMWTRGGSLSIPQRLGHVGSLWGVFPIQEEVLPIDGIPTVCPALPILYVFDHRLFDGVMGGRILQAFGQILLDPAAEFGVDGQSPPIL